MPQASSKISFVSVPPSASPASETALTVTDRLTRYDRETPPALALDILAGVESRETSWWGFKGMGAAAGVAVGSDGGVAGYSSSGTFDMSASLGVLVVLLLVLLLLVLLLLVLSLMPLHLARAKVGTWDRGRTKTSCQGEMYHARRLHSERGRVGGRCQCVKAPGVDARQISRMAQGAWQHPVHHPWTNEAFRCLQSRVVFSLRPHQLALCVACPDLD